MDEIAIEETGPDFLLATLEHYLESGDYSDVVLISQDGDRLPAHRAVLSSVSEPEFTPKAVTRFRSPKTLPWHYVHANAKPIFKIK